MHQDPYRSLMTTVGIHFFIMYALTYAAVDAWGDISPFSTRSLYMTVIMVSPMVILMVYFMSEMYKDKQRNVILYLGSSLAFVLFFSFIREQTFVDNERFLDSMIPHHSSAITMCEEANITDAEIQALCKEIINSQKEEIRQMKEIRTRLNYPSERITQ